MSPVSFPGAPCWPRRRGEAQGGADRSPFKSSCALGNSSYLCAPLFSRSGTLRLLRLQSTGPANTPLREALDDVARQVAPALASPRLQDRLLRQSIRDPLTGLYNRRHLESQLSAGVAAALASHVPLSLIALDIDPFKRLNDAFGHDAGDAAPVRISAVLRDLAPPGSTPARRCSRCFRGSPCLSRRSWPNGCAPRGRGCT